MNEKTIDKMSDACTLTGWSVVCMGRQVSDPTDPKSLMETSKAIEVPRSKSYAEALRIAAEEIPFSRIVEVRTNFKGVSQSVEIVMTNIGILYNEGSRDSINLSIRDE